MPDIYARLFRYTARADFEPLENFLTESLGDLLERMTIADKGLLDSFVSDVLCGSEIPGSLNARINGAARLEWKTQEKIRCEGELGYLDLCLIADGELVLILENKVGADFTTHSAASNETEIEEENEDQTVSQLDFYKKHLKQQSKPTALVLLTHQTDPPSSFALRQGFHGGDTNVFESVCRWGAVHRWFKEAKSLHDISYTTSVERAALKVLAQEFCTFLERQQMNAVELKREDLKPMEEFFSSDMPRKLHELFLSLRKAIRSLPELDSKYGFPAKHTLRVKDGLIWDWFYCFDKELKWFINWGISSRNVLSRFYAVDAIDSDAPLSVFALIGSELKDIPLTSDQLASAQKTGWLVYKTRKGLRLVKRSDPEMFFKEDEGVKPSFEKWTINAIQEGYEMLRLTHGQTTHLR
jgi:hypothetical protein